MKIIPLRTEAIVEKLREQILSIRTDKLVRISPDIKRHDPFYLAILAELSNCLASESIKLSVIDPFKVDSTPIDEPLIIRTEKISICHV